MGVLGRLRRFYSCAHTAIAELLTCLISSGDATQLPAPPSSILINTDQHSLLTTTVLVNAGSSLRGEGQPHRNSSQGSHESRGLGSLHSLNTARPAWRASGTSRGKRDRDPKNLQHRTTLTPTLHLTSTHPLHTMATTETGERPPTRIPDILSRRRVKQSGDEEATQTIRLGDFTDDQTLSVSEARALLNTLIDRRKDDPSVPPPPQTDVFVRTRKYMNQASRHKSQAAAEQVANISSKLSEAGLITGFERAQLSM